MARPCRARPADPCSQPGVPAQRPSVASGPGGLLLPGLRPPPGGAAPAAPPVAPAFPL